MTLASQMLTDLSVFFNTDDFAVTVTHKTAGAKYNTTFSAIFDRTQDLAGFDLYQTQADLGLLTMKLSDVPSAAYGRGDLYQIAGVTWRCEQVLRTDGYVIEMVLSTDRRIA
jgi:hypothetical protein